MPSPSLILALLLASSFSLATVLGLWREQSPRQQTRSGSVLEILMGDSRRLFANHFVTKADVYLHSGVYPSIFEQAQRAQRPVLAKESHSTGSDLKPAEPTVDPDHTPHDEHAEHDEHDHQDHHEHGPGEHADHPGHEICDTIANSAKTSRDWIDSFGRNFIPTQHVHLGDKGDPREILPWLRLAAELNPNQADIYPLAAYWLRQRMGKAKEAEQFLREGWHANPDSFEILFELGRLYEENHKDDARARNLFELALKKWDATESAKPEEERNDLAFMQLTGHLARLEERAGNLPKAILFLEMLKKVSPNPDSIQTQIAELRAKAESKR